LNVSVTSLRTDGGTQVRAQIDLFTVEDYADAMLNGATFPAVVAYYDGTDYWLADGFHRVEAAKRANVELAVDVRAGTVRDAKLHAAGSNADHGLRRTNEDKRRAVLMLLKDDEWKRWSDREIARKAGVTHPFVTRLRSLETVTSDDSERVYVDRYGNERVMNTANIGGAPRDEQPEPSFFGMDEDEEDDVDEDAPINPRDWATEDDVYAAGKAALEEEYERELAQYEGREPEPEDEPRPHVANNSGNNEWYTPPEFTAAAHRVMGGIDLDPASSEVANRTVNATAYFTADDDGLTRPWAGRVFLNPPYSGDLVGRFAAKALDELHGDVTEAIILVNNATETAWFQTLAERAQSICFPKGRIRYLDATGQPKQSPLQGQAFFYFGPNSDEFGAVFSEFGVIK